MTVDTNVSGHAIVVMFGEHRVLGTTTPNNVTNLIAVQGVGQDVPGVSELRLSDTQVAVGQAGGIPTGSTVRLHSISVRVDCGSTATTAKGFFYAGTMPGNIIRTSYTSWNSVHNALLGRPQYRQYTAFSATQAPIQVYSAPQDAFQWSQFDLAAAQDSTVLANNVSTDSLLPIVVGFLPTGTSGAAADSVTYNLTVHCEWRIIFPMGDARALLHAQQANASQSVLGMATKAVAASGGSGWRPTLRGAQMGPLPPPSGLDYNHGGIW